MTVLLELARVVAALTGGAFAGACLYIMLVQQPSRMARSTAAALDDFRESIPRAERLQAPLLVVCILAAVLEAALRFSWPVTVGAVLMIVVLALTIASVLPINRRLLSGEPADHLPEAGTALTRWGTLHTVRTMIAVVGAAALIL